MVEGHSTPLRQEDGTKPTTRDATSPTRTVSTKPANRPFLAYKEYRNKQEALHVAWLRKKEERDAKIARGESVGPLEPDPTAHKEVGLLGLLKFILYLMFAIALAGKFITGSFTWEYQSKWLLLKSYWPTGQRLFSERLLAEFDGSTPGKPIYLAIDGDVYDVTGGTAYQPGGSYHFFAGIDAARAFGTGCFKVHQTYDIRGLDESEQNSLDHWKKFYAEHPSYSKVGRVLHKPINPASPIPEHCDPKKRVQSGTANEAGSPHLYDTKKDSRMQHKEL